MMCVVAIAVTTMGSFSQSVAQEYYVVVGAFAKDDRASQLTDQSAMHHMDTLLSMMRKQDLVQFYVMTTDNPGAVREKTDQIRSTITESLYSPDDRVRAIASTSPSSGLVAGGSTSENPAHLSAVPPKPVGKYFKFRVESPEGQVLQTRIHHIDIEEGRQLATYETNTLVDLLRPGEAAPMAMICNLFGYKEAPQLIDYRNPARSVQGAYIDQNGIWVIPFKLQRVGRGDVSLMPNVVFHKDAAIMEAGARNDLDELVRLMHSNPYYEIVIHAHCNGRGKREINIPVDRLSFFEPDSVQTVVGRAKDLTTARAELVRNYLLDNGIEPRRVNIFSWGSSDMLVKPSSEYAHLNDRIEIEFIRD